MGVVPHSETFINGVWYPSVTTVMGVEPKPWLQAWREKWGPLAERKLKIAGQIGTEFHRCIDQYLETGGFIVSNEGDGFPTSCTARVKGMMKSFIDWAVTVDGIIEATELKVVSRLYTYSGTLDAVGTLDGKPIIFDWKTSNRIYDDMALQLAAYAQAFNERTLNPEWVWKYKNGEIRFIKDGIIVQVSKDKPRFKLTVKSFKLGKRVFNKFLKLRGMFDDMSEKEPVNAETIVGEETGC